MAVVALAPPRPPLSSPIRFTSNHNRVKERIGALGKVLRVARRDWKFIGARLGPLQDRLRDFFWLRQLEDPHATNTPRLPSSWPKISYPQGLSGMDLLMADLEASKVYANYLQHSSRIWSMPLPEYYDQQKVADYFNCRPHILTFRFLEVFSSFASAVIKLQVSRTFNFNRHGVDNNDSSESSQYFIGQLLKESMLNLGPAFVKVGQSLSTRPDIIGQEISEVLSELHDKIPPFPRATAMEIIEEELGCPVETIFSYISDEPVAAASFGQVYRGRTLDGYKVAVKVQRPNLLHTVVRDIYILRLGLELLRKVAQRKNDLCGYADELGKGLVGELDYRLEASNASEFLEAHAAYSFISVPKVFLHLTRKRVLTMEWIVGENPNDLLYISRGLEQENVPSSRQLPEAKSHLLDLVNKGVEASLVQLLETGLLHADPHPGNLRYTPDGRIGFLDFGLVCRMEKKHQLAMLASIVHIVNGDWGALVYDLTLMDVVSPGADLRSVTMDLEETLGDVVFKDGIPEIKFSRVLGKIWSIALKYHFSMPPYYPLVLRSLASFEGLALAADQDFKTFQAAYPYVVRRLLHDNSAATRQILYSVVFNKRREIQWQKILLFLRIGSSRNGSSGLNRLRTNKSPVDHRNLREEVFQIANLILTLLPSKDGAVLRRLLMTADGPSLARAMVSKDARLFRQHVSRALAGIIYQWMVEAVEGSVTSNHYDHLSVPLKMQQERDMDLPSSPSIPALQAVLRDRRLKVIFYKILSGVKSNPVLMLRVSWVSFTIFVTASSLALHRLLVYWSETYVKSVPSSPTAVSL